MSRLLLDTHVLLWALWDSPKLSRDLAARLESLGRSDPPIFVSPFTLWEIALLARKRRLQIRVEPHAFVQTLTSDSRWAVAAFDWRVAVESQQLPGEFHEDPADRAIVATARVHGLTLVTADRPILRYAEAGHIPVLAA